jgi:hypothetical protein
MEGGPFRSPFPYLKPDSFDDGPPASSKAGILEALLDRVIRSVQSNEDLFNETAIFVTFDEGAGRDFMSAAPVADTYDTLIFAMAASSSFTTASGSGA